MSVQLAVATIWLLGIRVGAETQPCRQTIPVSVTDFSGKPIFSLSAGDFYGRVNKAAVNVQSAQMDSGPRIVLLLDASGSMVDSNEVWKPALDVTRSLVNRLPTGPLLSFLVFANQVDKMVDFTPQRGPVLQQIDVLQAGAKAFKKGLRRTSLWDTVLDALQSFGEAHVGDAIYAVTDGGDNESKSKLPNVEKELINAGVRFFAVLAPPARGTLSPEEQSGPIYLAELAKATGGFMLVPYTMRLRPVMLSPAQLGREMDLLYSWTFNFYRIEIETPHTVLKPRDWQLEVIGGSHGSGQGFVVGYPHRLEPCSSNSKNSR